MCMSGMRAAPVGSSLTQLCVHPYLRSIRTFQHDNLPRNFISPKIIITCCRKFKKTPTSHFSFLLCTLLWGLRNFNLQPSHSSLFVRHLQFLRHRHLQLQQKIFPQYTTVLHFHPIACFHYPWLKLLLSHTLRLSVPSQTTLSSRMAITPLRPMGSFIVLTILLSSDLCFSSTITPRKVSLKAPKPLSRPEFFDKGTIVPIDVNIIHSPILEVSDLRFLFTAITRFLLMQFADTSAFRNL